MEEVEAMNERRHGAIGSWGDDKPVPTFTPMDPVPAEAINPHDYDDDPEFQQIVIDKRRAAGLPDYPPDKE